jgi:hypothetical protein
MIANRCVFSLNRLYSSSTAALPPPSTTIHLKQQNFIPPSISRDLNTNAFRSLAAVARRRSPTEFNTSASPIDFNMPHMATRSQRRLLTHIRSQCATFVNNARGSNATSMDISVVNDEVRSIFQSYSFVDQQLPQPRRLGSPNHSPCLPTPSSRSTPRPASAAPHSNTTMAVKPGSTPFVPRPHYVNIEGPLPGGDLSHGPSAGDLTSSYSSASTAVVPLLADRIALPEALNIVPLASVLPPIIAARYQCTPADAAASPLLRPQAEILALNLTTRICETYRSTSRAGHDSFYIFAEGGQRCIRRRQGRSAGSTHRRRAAG